ncbi:MAG: hypothetical protein K0S76_1455 [Herbinix sp.]|jgi:hypothetical protein|nr:hypothetical protein [Herbinix sp.]
MTHHEIYHEVDIVVKNRLLRDSDEINQRVVHLQEVLNHIYYPTMEQMLKLFELKWDDRESEIVCFLGCCPVFPRNVITKEYYVNHNTVDDKLIKASIHELNHFVLFEKWKSMHGYDRATEPIHPEPLWFLEEIAIDPTLNEELMQKVAPYPQTAYQQFYEQTIDGMSVMDQIKKIYIIRENMADFLDKAHMYITSNIDEIVHKCG